MVWLPAAPTWWFDLLTTEPRVSDVTFADFVGGLLDPRLTFDDLAKLRESWSGPLVVKGVQNVEDARRSASPRWTSSTRSACVSFQPRPATTTKL